MTLSGVAALEEWCRRALDGSGVQVSNMTSSWRDGLAFCALIHRYRPDLIDLGNLDTRDWRGNLELAFSVAEKQLGIASLLDPEDLLSTPSPDRFSVLTYLSQFYHTFCQVDSGISSCNQSPVLSDNELESTAAGNQLRRRSSIAGGSGSRSTTGLDTLASRLLRSNSTVTGGSSGSRRRGAIHSLMDGRRVRSLSCGAGAGRRGLRQLPPVDSQPPIQSENPFNNAELMQGISADTNKLVKNLVNGFKSSYNMNDNDNNNKENKSLQTMSENGLIKGEDKGSKKEISATKPVTSEVKKVNLREKKQRGTSGSEAGIAGVNNGGKERRERVTKSLILETDFSESVPSTTLTNSVIMTGMNQLRTSVSNLREKSSSTLSFTSIPSPYRRQDMNSSHQANGGINSGQSSLSLLSKSCSYRNISSGGGYNAPPKPLRTYTHNLQRQSSVPPEMMDYSSIVESMLNGSAVNNGEKCSVGYNSTKTRSSNGTKSEMNLSHAILQDRSNLLHDRSGGLQDRSNLLQDRSMLHDRSGLQDRSNDLADHCSRTPFYMPSSMSLSQKFRSCVKTGSKSNSTPVQNSCNSSIIQESNTALRESSEMNTAASNFTGILGKPRMGIQATQTPPKRLLQSPQSAANKPSAGDVNNNEMKERFTNYPIRKLTPESSFRHLVKLRLTTDIFRRITASAANGNGGRNVSREDKLNGGGKGNRSTAKTSLPYLQTLV